jgi:putative endonuclease
VPVRIWSIISQMPDHQYFVYILTTTKNTVLYTGVTNDLIRRVYEHKNNLVDGFTKRYNVHKLVYYETVEDIIAAIEREKQIKSWNRGKKVLLINAFNPDWLDLYNGISGG